MIYHVEKQPFHLLASLEHCSWEHLHPFLAELSSFAFSV